MPHHPVRNVLERQYRHWLHTHADVYALFERFALEMQHRQRRFGIGLLTERVRWEVVTTWNPDDEGFKINNNFRAYIARDLIRQYPGLAALLQTRTITRKDPRDWDDLL